MKTVFAYIRVSTPKQGTQGSSLQEQRGAIEAYAQRHGIAVAEWFEETETAAKRGRPNFNRMIKALAKGGAQGVVIHKIDRSARNLRDWADLGDLIDRGIEIHFAHESLDLLSRGGRLSADIQAVVAADFIRNLRQEVKKGFYGRLKQGLYPLGAPLGYRDMGRGQPKEPDPIQAPLVRQAFELYATGEFNFHTLQAELNRRGLRGRNGSAISKNGLTTMLNNPFYIGLIHIKKTKEMFQGVHTPLVRKALYDRVQAVLRGNRLTGAAYKNVFVFRCLIRCAHCNRHLIGERQKGRYVYYRCHGRVCGVVSLSERVIDARIRELLGLLRLDDEEIREVRDIVDEMRNSDADENIQAEAQFKIRIAKCDDRLSRLTDAFIDNLIDKELFESRKEALLKERRGLRDSLENLSAKPSLTERVTNKLELANTAYSQYENGIPAEKRDIVVEAVSNFSGDGNYPAITLKSPLHELVEWRASIHSELGQDNARTRAKQIFNILMSAAAEETDPVVSKERRE